MSNRFINKVTPPALPIPPGGVFQRYLADLNNILRLFFNSLGNTVNLLTGGFGGRFIEVPNALYFSTADQALVASNTAQAVTFNQTYLENGFGLNGASNSQITATYGGVYNFQLTLTLTSTSGSSKDVYVWITRNGTDLGYTTRPYNISGSGRMLDIQWVFDIDVAAGEYLEFYWSGTSTNLELGASAAVTPHPGIPSAVVTVNFISVLPETRPTPP